MELDLAKLNVAESVTLCKFHGENATVEGAKPFETIEIEDGKIVSIIEHADATPA